MAEKNMLLPELVGKPLGGGDLRNGIVGFRGSGNGPGLGAALGGAMGGFDKLAGVLGRMKDEKDNEMLNRFLVDANNERMEALRTMRDMQGVNAEDALAMFHLSNFDIRDRYANAAPEHMREKFLIAYDRGEGPALNQVDAFQRSEAMKLEQTALAQNLVQISGFTDQHIQEFGQTQGINAQQTYESKLQQIIEGWDKFIADADPNQREVLKLEKLKDVHRAARLMRAHRDRETAKLEATVNAARMTQIGTRAITDPTGEWRPAVRAEIARAGKLNGWSQSPELMASLASKTFNNLAKRQIEYQIGNGNVAMAKRLLDMYENMGEAEENGEIVKERDPEMPSEETMNDLRKMVKEASRTENNYRWAKEIGDKYAVLAGNEKNNSEPDVNAIYNYNDEVLMEQVNKGDIEIEDAQSQLSQLRRRIERAQRVAIKSRQDRTIALVNDITSMKDANGQPLNYEDAQKKLDDKTAKLGQLDKDAANKALKKRYGKGAKPPILQYRAQVEAISRAVDTREITDKPSAFNFCTRNEYNLDEKLLGDISKILSRESAFFNYGRIDRVARMFGPAFTSAPLGFGLYLAQMVPNGTELTDDIIRKYMNQYLYEEGTVAIGTVQKDAKTGKWVYQPGTPLTLREPDVNRQKQPSGREKQSRYSRRLAMSGTDLEKHYQMLETRGAFASQGRPVVNVDGLYGQLIYSGGKWSVDFGNNERTDLPEQKGRQLYAKYNRLDKVLEYEEDNALYAE